MIIKMIQGQDFSGLEHYLTHAREHQILGCHGVSSPAAAAEEMALVAAERQDVKVPALHVIFAASPTDWAKMCPALWRELTTDFEAEFGLAEHQKLEVKHPHPDKQTDGPHVHAAYNKVHPSTFALPDKVLGGRSSWDSAAPHRAWLVADDFAQRHGLTRVADPTKVEAAGRIPNWMLKRELRDGVVPIALRAPEIREALANPDWSMRIRSLAALGLEISPTYPTGAADGEGAPISGIRIVDAADQSNFLKASAFGREFSYAALELSRVPGSPELSIVLADPETQQAIEQGLARPFDARALYHLEFENDLEAWRERKKKLKGDRDKMLAQHKGEQQALKKALQAERVEVLNGTPTILHRAARTMFNSMEATPRRLALKEKQVSELVQLRSARRPLWAEWLSEKAAAGDKRAAELLRSMSNQGRKMRLKAGSRASAVQGETPKRTQPVIPPTKSRHTSVEPTDQRSTDHSVAASAEKVLSAPTAGAVQVQPPVGSPAPEDDYLHLQRLSGAYRTGRGRISGA